MDKPISRVRGDTYPIKVTVLKQGKPYDLTDCTATLTGSAKEDPTHSDAALFCIPGEIQQPPSGGIILFVPTAAQMDQAGRVYFDVSITDAAGYVRTPYKSHIDFTTDITK